MPKTLQELFGPRAATGARGRAVPKAHAGKMPSRKPARKTRQPLAPKTQKRQPRAPAQRHTTKKHPLGFFGGDPGRPCSQASRQSRAGCLCSLPVRCRCLQKLPVARGVPGSRWRLGPWVQNLRRHGRAGPEGCARSPGIKVGAALFPTSAHAGPCAPFPLGTALCLSAPQAGGAPVRCVSNATRCRPEAEGERTCVRSRRCRTCARSRRCRSHRLEGTACQKAAEKESRPRREADARQSAATCGLGGRVGSRWL